MTVLGLRNNGVWMLMRLLARSSVRRCAFTRRSAPDCSRVPIECVYVGNWNSGASDTASRLLCHSGANQFRETFSSSADLCESSARLCDQSVLTYPRKSVTLVRKRNRNPT